MSKSRYFWSREYVSDFPESFHSNAKTRTHTLTHTLTYPVCKLPWQEIKYSKTKSQTEKFRPDTDILDVETPR